MNEPGFIHIFITGQLYGIKSNSFSLFFRLIVGNYPNISRLLATNPKTIITLNTNLLLKGIDRACLFESEQKNNNVQLEIKDGTKIRISSSSSEMGKIEETQNIIALNGGNDLSITLD